jgi:hypothetical protein
MAAHRTAGQPASATRPDLVTQDMDLMALRT